MNIDLNKRVYSIRMRVLNKNIPTIGLALSYAVLLGLAWANAADTNIDPRNNDQRLNSLTQAPEPGSEGDTLTIEDKRMAYLVYKLLGKDGKIKGANLERGSKLFYQNCRPCHGEDGRRVNVTPTEARPTYIGERARYDMPTFWYQMNFGDDARNMEAYFDEIPLDEMVDIAGFAQTLP